MAQIYFLSPNTHLGHYNPMDVAEPWEADVFENFVESRDCFGMANEFTAGFDEFDDCRDPPALPPHVTTRDSLKRIARLGDGAREVIANAVTRLNDAVRHDPAVSDGAKKNGFAIVD